MSDENPGRLLGFIAAAVVVGVLTGLMAATFTRLIEILGRRRTQVIGWAHGSPALVAVVVLVCGLATALAAWMVRQMEPHAEGSGIPRVEAVAAGRIEPGSARILPVKYVGGLLAIGAGLALGREGPSVQMGGNIGIIVSRVLRRTRHDLRVLVAAGAAAGLATAFNAPIAGGVFVLEELLKRYDPRTATATLIASASGFASAHLLIGTGTDFTVRVLPEPTLWHSPAVLIVGVLTGVLGAGYNWLVLRGLRFADTSRWPVELRAGLIGGAVGLVAWFAPDLVGGGDNLTQRALIGTGTLLGVVGVLVIRTVLGVVSYAALTPGGLFAPMLVLGTHIGLLVGLLGQALTPSLTPQPAALAVIGMAAFFTATVRAPITGIILATEMTGSTAMLAPMLGACAIAMLVATVLKSEPIYDALTARSVRARQENATDHHGSQPGMTL